MESYLSLCFPSTDTPYFEPDLPIYLKMELVVLTHANPAYK